MSQVKFKNKKIVYICLVMFFGFSYLFLFFNLGAYSLKEPDEGRYAEIPREMIENGNFLVPYLNYVRYFEKPPLLYWIVAGSYKAFGVSEWSFRFPNAIAALFCVVITFFFASKWFSKRTGILSSFILLSSFGFFALARIVTIDMLFTFLLFTSLSSFYEFYCKEKLLFFYLFYVALALATLAKGPVAVILIGVTIIIYLLVEKNISFLKKIFSIKGLIVFAMIAVPWFVYLSIKEKEFFYFFFIDQHLLRFLTTKHHRSGPIYYFLPVLLGGLFPWSIFIPRAFIDLRRAEKIRLFLIWPLVVFGFFSLSGSKLPPYIMPIFPAVAIILAVFFDMKWKNRIQKSLEIIVYVIFFSCVVIGCFMLEFGLLNRYLINYASLSQDIKSFAFEVSLVSLFILIFLFFRKTCTFRSFFFMLNTFSLSVVLGLMLNAHIIDRFNTTKELSEIINRTKSNVIVVSYGSFDETLPFYLKRRTYLAGTTGELEMGAKYPEARQFFLNKDQFLQLFQSDKPVFTVMKKKRTALLQEPGFENARIIKCQDTRCVIANKKAQELLWIGGKF